MRAECAPPRVRLWRLYTIVRFCRLCMCRPTRQTDGAVADERWTHKHFGFGAGKRYCTARYLDIDNLS